MPLAPPTELLFHFSKYLDNLLLTSDDASLSGKPLVFITHSYLYLEIEARQIKQIGRGIKMFEEII